MRNTPLSIETGNHYQHSMMEMLSLLVMMGRYHYKECQAHFHPFNGYPLACTDQFEGNRDVVETPGRPRSRFLSCKGYASSWRTASISLSSETADLSIYHMTAEVDGQELHGQ